MDYSTFRHIADNDRNARRSFKAGFRNSDNFNERLRLFDGNEYFSRTNDAFNGLDSSAKPFVIDKPITHSFQFRKVLAKAKINNAPISDLVKIMNSYDSSKKQCTCPTKRNFKGDDVTSCHCRHYKE